MTGNDNEILTSDGSGGITSETNFTYSSGTNNVLTLTASYNKVNTKTYDNLTSDQTIDSFTTDFGCASIFEYCITESGGAKRMGQVYATWDSSSATYTDISTPDLNSSTADFIWKVEVINNNLVLVAVIVSGSWNVLVATRIIF